MEYNEHLDILETLIRVKRSIMFMVKYASSTKQVKELDNMDKTVSKIILTILGKLTI